MEIWKYIVLVLVVLIGGLGGILFGSKRKVFLPIALSFTGAYILGITAMSLLPSVYIGASAKIGIWMLVGFLLQLAFESLSKGVEHGHIHALHQEKQMVYVIQVLIGLSLHAFLEGLPISGIEEIGHQHQHHHEENLFWAIILHKAPAAFALSILLITNGLSRIKALLVLLLFALMTPMGAWVGSFWQADYEIMRVFLAILIGGFFHISTLILFENDKDSNQHHQFSILKMLIILFGFFLAYIVS